VRLPPSWPVPHRPLELSPTSPWPDFDLLRKGLHDAELLNTFPHPKSIGHPPPTTGSRASSCSLSGSRGVQSTLMRGIDSCFCSFPPCPVPPTFIRPYPAVIAFRKRRPLPALHQHPFPNPVVTVPPRHSLPGPCSPVLQFQRAFLCAQFPSLSFRPSPFDQRSLSAPRSHQWQASFVTMPLTRPPSSLISAHVTLFFFRQYTLSRGLMSILARIPFLTATDVMISDFLRRCCDAVFCSPRGCDCNL